MRNSSETPAKARLWGEFWRSRLKVVYRDWSSQARLNISSEVVFILFLLGPLGITPDRTFWSTQAQGNRVEETLVRSYHWDPLDFTINSPNIFLWNEKNVKSTQRFAQNNSQSIFLWNKQWILQSHCEKSSPVLVIVVWKLTGHHWITPEFLGRQRGAEPRAEEMFSFFGIIFASQKSMLRGFHPCHIGTLDFALCRDGFSGWIFWRPFFGGIYCSYCRKTHTENSGKISVEKFGDNIPFSVHFSVRFFGTFLRCVFRWATKNFLFASKSEKFVQNPFCERDPLRTSEKSTGNFTKQFANNFSV